jgi:hypothetical protein
LWFLVTESSIVRSLPHDRRRYLVDRFVCLNTHAEN